MKLFQKKIDFHIDIVTNTVGRAEIGYKYLIEVFESIKKEFVPLNVNFTVHALEMHGGKNPIQDPHFNYLTFTHEIFPEKDDPSFLSPRDRKIWKQNMDFISGMRKYKPICQDIFLYIEDDFIFCENSALHILSVYQWALRHKDDIGGVKFSYGFSGNIMKCSDIERYISQTIKDGFRKGNTPFPYDWGIGTMWSPYWNDPRMGMHIYRYNLLWHIGKISAVGNQGNVQDNYRSNQLKCFDMMNHASVFMNEKFDMWECPESMISPCKNPIVNEFEYRDSPEVIIDLPLTPQLKRINPLRKEYKIHAGHGSCENVCSIYEMVCNPHYFPMINNVKEMPELGLKYCLRSNEEHAPYFDDSKCIVKTQLPFSCKAEGKEKRLCPCSSE